MSKMSIKNLWAKFAALLAVSAVAASGSIVAQADQSVTAGSGGKYGPQSQYTD
ncbi:MAG: hypothetical protein J6M18_03595 [Actinomycetaceae bacterium]|nr:hypothetical protein [Actinomycetaceae bacterium]